MENWQWVVDIFTFIGIAVSIIIALIAIVWLTCFFVKLLVKTFGMRVGKSYDLMVEDINKKAEAKKIRNEKKRSEKLAQKMELLNMKLESKARVHEMKKAKLEGKLETRENAAKVRLFGEDAPEIKQTKKVEAKPVQKAEPVIEEKVDADIAEIAEITDGDAETIEAQIEEKIEPKKKNSKKKS